MSCSDVFVVAVVGVAGRLSFSLSLRESGRTRDAVDGATRRRVWAFGRKMSLLERVWRAGFLAIADDPGGRGGGCWTGWSGIDGNFSSGAPSVGGEGTGGGCDGAPLSRGADLATRRCTRLRTLRRVSIGFLDRDLGPMDSESESDSQTDCSQYASDLAVHGLSFSRLGEVLVTSRARRDDVELRPGLGTGLGQSLAGMKNAWSKCVACGSIVTGLMRLGGEIMEGSIWVRWVSFWVVLVFCPLRAMLGRVGRGFPRRLYRTWGSSFCMVKVSVGSFAGRAVPLLLRVGF